ncbi:uncharacterized protein LOC144716279 isoform X2 [Wolffia australiana]
MERRGGDSKALSRIGHGGMEEKLGSCNHGGVMLEGYAGAVRTKSLTEDDLEELKGCLDLGFGFSYEEIPELCGTLPALELCYSMDKRFVNASRREKSPRSVLSPNSSQTANWKFCEPGDDPEEVKARLKYWAQTVAWTLRMCSS